MIYSVNNNLIKLSCYEKYFEFNFILNKLKEQIIQIEVCSSFPLNSNVIIKDSIFPYPLYIYDSIKVNIYFENCTFTNIGCRDINYLLYLNSLNNSSYTILNGNILKIPVFNEAINPIQTQFDNASLFFNKTYFTIIWYGGLIGYLDSNVFNQPVIILKGQKRFSISNPVTLPVVLKKGEESRSLIYDTTFCNGVTLNLTNLGEIIFDNCVIFTPPIISSNVYVIKSVNNNGFVSFRGNSSILMTGYGNSYLWNVKGNANLETLVTPISRGKVNLVLGKGQEISLVDVPYNLINNNIYINDSSEYTFTISNSSPTLRLLTSTSDVYKTLLSSVGYRIAFNSKIKSLSKGNISITSNSESKIYSDANTNINVKNLYLTNNSNDPYMLYTTGPGSITFEGNITLNLTNGRNFWYNSANVILKTNSISQNLQCSTYNCAPNAEEYPYINLNSSYSPYHITSSELLYFSCESENIIIENSTFSNGIGFVENSYPISIINSTLENVDSIYLITSNVTTNLINVNLILNSYNYVTANINLINVNENSLFKLKGNLSTLNSFNSTEPNFSRQLERLGNVVLISENCNYNLSGITNYGIDTKFDLTVSANIVTISLTVFDMEVNLFNFKKINFNSSNFSNTLNVGHIEIDVINQNNFIIRNLNI